MGTALRAVRGMPRMQEVPGSGTSGIYQDSLTIPGGGYSSGQILTLPNSGNYEDKDLQVYRGGQFWEEGQDFNYVGSSPRTQIEILHDLEAGEVIKFRVEGNAGSIYDEVIVIGAGGLVGGSSITLPSSKTYSDIDLKVYLNGQFLEAGEDYNYVGATPPRTQIQTIFDLLEGERLRLRIES